MLVIVCPGQGSQTPGFLAPWLEVDGVAEQVGAWSEAIGIDLIAHGTTSDAETITDTAIAQPLIVAAGLLSARALGPACIQRAGAVSGHSVGEITAATLAGVLTPAEALQFVTDRGRLMARDAAATPTGMSAVVGGDADEVARTIAEHGLTAANANGGGQVVAAGALPALAALSEAPPAKARVIPLRVAGAFHTSFMEPAERELAELTAGLRPADPHTPWVSNADGQLVDAGAQVLSRLVAQVSRPVRWDLCQQRFAELGITGLIELSPAGTLVGLAKRSLKGVPAVALKSPADLDAAAELIAATSEVHS
ncbi:ACP S-malonyltransferase [Dermacoccaceae bacterium W4C1]